MKKRFMALALAMVLISTVMLSFSVPVLAISPIAASFEDGDVNIQVSAGELRSNGTYMLTVHRENGTPVANSFTANANGGLSATLRIGMAEGTHTISIVPVGTGGKTLMGEVIVVLPVTHNLALTVDPAAANSEAGGTVSVNFTINRGGYTGALTITSTPAWMPQLSLPAGSDSTISGTVTVPAETAANLHNIVFTVARVSTQPGHITVNSGTAALAVTVTEASVTPNPAVTSVTVTPATANVQQGDTRQFTHTLVGTDLGENNENLPENQRGVTWTASAGTIANGLLTVPATVPVGTEITVTATSVFNTNAYGTATATVTAATVTPVVTAVTVTPATANVQQGSTRQFSAEVAGTNLADNQRNVTWSATAGGTITASGLLTVPSSTTAGTIITVTARSVFDNSVYGTARVTVTAAAQQPPSGGTRPPSGGGAGGWVLRPITRPSTPTVTTPTQPGTTAQNVSIAAPQGEQIVNIPANTLQQLASGNAALEITTDYATVTIPAAALRSIMNQAGGNVDIGIIVDATDSGVTVNFSIASGNTIISALPVPVQVSVALDDIGDINHHRLVATLEDGTIVGGSYDPATGLFTFETAITGEFIISYVENLNRLVVQLGSNIIIDLAGNAETQNMDVPPQIIDGRTMMPLRFMANALDANIGWNEAAREVTLALDGRILVLPIGQITSELAALGMDVPPMIIDGRTMVPLRFISEFFDAIVNWEDAARTIEVIR